MTGPEDVAENNNDPVTDYYFNEAADSQTATRGHDDWVYPDDLLAGAWHPDPYGPDEFDESEAELYENEDETELEP